MADATTAASSPIIKTMCPAEGWCQGGSTAVLIGENFHDGLQVCFGTTSVWGEVILDFITPLYIFYKF